MNEVVQLSLEKELENLKGEIDKLTQSESTRDNTLKKRLPEFELLRSRVKTFSSVLSFEAQALLKKVQAAQNVLEGELGVTHITPKSEPTPEPQPVETPVYDQAAGF